MVRKVIHTNKIFYSISLAIAVVSLLIALPLIASQSSASATACSSSNSANPCDVVFQVNVDEVLAVSLTSSTAAQTGDHSTFLRNNVDLSVTSNNSVGFLAYMTAKTATTALSNGGSGDYSTIATLASDSTRSDFPNNRWGYSIDDTSEGLTTSTYKAVPASTGTPATVLCAGAASCASTTAPAGTQSKTVYFGAKADANYTGTYANTVIFTVVAGVNTYDGNKPSNPTNPTTNEGKDGTTSGGAYYAYNSGANATVYTKYTEDTSAKSGTTNSVIYSGDTTSSNLNPLGVTTTSIGEGTPLAIGLAVTAGVAATAGIIFFIIAKRKRDDEEDEEE